MSNYYQTNSATRETILKRFSMFDGVGLDISGETSYEDALNAAGINYTASKKKLYLADGTEVQGHFAVVKSDDDSKILGVVGSQYQAVSNADAFSIAEDVVDLGYATYECGGPAINKKCADYSKAFMVLRGDDFDVCGDTFNSFIIFNNSFDGSTGVQYRVVCLRVVCQNGMVSYLGNQRSQVQIKISHTQSAAERIQKANKIVMQREEEIEQIKREAEFFSNIRFTRQQFEKEIIPLVLKEKKLVENDKERERGHERIDRVVSELLQAYNADDVQNYSDNAYRTILALSDYESHAEPLRNTGNGQIYMNRIVKGMALTTAVAQYINDAYGGFGKRMSRRG